MARRKPVARRRSSWLRRLVLLALFCVIAVYGVWATGLLLLRWFDPWTTGVQVQRRLEALAARKPYQKRYEPVKFRAISPHLPHAVVAAEDTRFFEHRGFDFKEIEKVAADGELERGASTLTQQLVKNLYLTTHRSILRKGIEITLTPLAELLLSKQRILELYLNSVEWGPGVYGAEAAARYHYGVPASALTREQAARLAALLPNPRIRKPGRMDIYAGVILRRMAQMGW